MLGQVPGEGTGQRAQAGALGLHGGHPARLQRRGGDRSHAGGDDRPGEGRDQRVLQTFRAGGVEHGQHGRGAGEGDRVHAAGDRLADQAPQRRHVAVGQPPVDRNLDDLRARLAQRGHETGQRLPVQLHGDAAPAQVLGEQVLLDLLARLRGRGPVVGQARRPDRAARLGPAGQQPGGGQVLGEVAGESPALGRRHPAAKTDAGGDHHVVDRGGQAGAGRGQQVGVLRQGHQPDRRGAHHPGAPAFQQRAELLSPPGGGDPDREPGQRVGRCLGRAGGPVQNGDAHLSFTTPRSMFPRYPGCPAARGPTPCPPVLTRGPPPPFRR